MGYSKKDWSFRLSERSDLSTSIVHLTRKSDERSALSNLFNIIETGQINGSTTESGFIVGATPAVCFQDAPLHSISQNIWFEEKFRKDNPNAKLRYNAAGLAFKKPYAFKNNARPVVYEGTSYAKELLPPEEWWRIVNFDLSNDDFIIDWTHEREWRCPNNFSFDLSEVTILLSNKKMYRSFMKTCENENSNIHLKIQGIVVLRELIF